MKICLFARNHPKYGVGGIGEFVYDLSQNLSGLGHEVHVIVSKYSENASNKMPVELMCGKVKYHFIEHPRFSSGLLFNFFYNIAAYKKARSLGKKIHFDVFNINSTLYGGLFLLLSRGNFKKVLTIHTSLKEEAHYADSFIWKIYFFIASCFEKICISKSDGVLFVSKFLSKKTFPKKDSMKKSAVIYPGVNSKIFSKKSTREKIPLFVFVGRLVKRKGIIYLKEFAQNLKQINSEAKIRVFGQGPAQKELSLISNIEIVGRVQRKDLALHFSKATALLFFSMDEGFGLVMLESMLCETPVIALNTGAVPEIISNKQNGIILGSNNMCRAAIIATELSQNKKILNSFGKKAREEIVKNFSWKESAKKTIDFYKSL